MKLAFAADHAGFALKQQLLEAARGDGHDAIDLGTHSLEPVDYPDVAAAIGRAVSRREVERGVLICGSGVGASVAANKLGGVRAAVCHDGYSAHQGVEHDDLNVLVLGSRVVGPSLALELMRLFLAARFSQDARHVRRLEKLRALER